MPRRFAAPGAAPASTARAGSRFRDDAFRLGAVAVAVRLDLRLLEMGKCSISFWSSAGMSWTSLTRIHAVSLSGTQMIFSSGPFSSVETV